MHVLTTTGSQVTVTDAIWNRSIPAGGSTSGVGFVGSYDGTMDPTPTGFTLNGVPCS